MIQWGILGVEFCSVWKVNEELKMNFDMVECFTVKPLYNDTLLLNFNILAFLSLEP